MDDDKAREPNENEATRRREPSSEERASRRREPAGHYPEANASGSPRGQHDASRELERRVGEKEARKLRARREKHRSIWFGLGMFGMIGWSVAVPALVGVAMGLWIDSTWPGPYSWTLMLLIAGVVVGCLNAWNWVRRESE